MGIRVPGSPSRWRLVQAALAFVSILSVFGVTPCVGWTFPFDGPTRPALAAALAADSSWWTQLLPTGGPPSGRAGASAIYDPLRHRMIVFGGFDGTTRLNDTWALSLDGDPVWTQLTPSGGPPPGRSVHTAIYDPIRDRMIVFGGTDASFDNSSNDVWALSLSGDSEWTEITPTGGPIPDRSSHSAIYDPIRDRMLVYGGRNSFNPFSDLWSLSLSGSPEWLELSPDGTGPGALAVHRAIYEPVSDAMIVFGGGDDSNTLHNDTWSLSLANTPAWTKLAPDGPLPPPRANHSMVFDAAHDRILVYGGCVNLDDTWALELSGTPTWVQASPTGTKPTMKCTHVTIFDPGSERMVIFGGVLSGQYLNEVWDLHWCSPCATTAVAVSLAAIPSADGGSVRLSWSRPDPTVTLLVIERREPTTEWISLAQMPAAADGVLSYEDRSVEPGRIYGYRVTLQSDEGRSYTNEVWVSTLEGETLRADWLAPARPNPTGGGIRLSMFLVGQRRVRLAIYDVQGRRMRGLIDASEPAGWTSAWWDGRDDAGTPARSGIYFARMEWDGLSRTRKIVLAR